MERSDATFGAYDGLELRLLGGQVVRVPDLTIAEAARFLRLLAAIESDGRTELERQEAHERFLAEFVPRAGISDVSLFALGMALELPGGMVARGEDISVARALQLTELLQAACQRSGWGAQSEFLDVFPPVLGSDGLRPPEVFQLGHQFAQHVYELLYGFARPFLSHLISTPGVRVMVMTTGTTGSLVASSSTRGSTT